MAESRQTGRQMWDLVSAMSDKGPARPNNQDTCWIPGDETPRELGSLYLVADGVGGQAEGALAAEIAAGTVSQRFYQLRGEGHPAPEALQQAVTDANQAIFQQAAGMDIRKMGCTLAAAAIEGSDIHLAHVGDARAYLVRGEKLYRMTKDDTWVQQQVEAGIITAKQAAKHEMRNIVTQVLGNKESVTVNSKSHRLQPDDILLLCSDGLYDTLSNSEMRRIIEEQGAADAAAALVAAASAGGASDNITAVVVGSSAPRPARSAAAGRSGSPGWLKAAGGAVLILLLAAAVYLALRGGGGDQGADALPTTDLPALLPAEEQSPALLPATSTIAPTWTAAPPPEASDTPAAPTPTPADDPPAAEAATEPPTAEPLPRACVINLVHVWQPAQLDAGDCNQFAPEGFSLARGTEVIVLGQETRVADGPDTACQPDNSFIEVQSAEDETVSGWILTFSIEPKEADQSCPE